MEYFLIYKWGEQPGIYTPLKPADIWWFLDNNPHIKPVSIYILEPFYTRLMSADEINHRMKEAVA